MNTILSVTLLLISGVSSRYLQCPESNGKFPVENSDCKSYYECTGWKVTTEKTCPDGQNFVPNLQRCDYEELYYCAEKEIEKYKRCKKSSGKFPKKNSMCRGYYECIKWKVTGEFTCPPRQNFNPEQQWCDWEELYPCLEDRPSEKCPKPNGYFPKLGSQCRSYYQCINSKAYELQCPDNQVFDSIHGQCEWPELYLCDETRESTTLETSRVTYTSTQLTLSTEETESTETTKTTKEYFTTASSERTKSSAETRTSFTTDSVPTKGVSQSTETDRTTGTSSATDRSSPTIESETTDNYILSSTESSTGTRTKGTGGTDGYTTAPTEDTSTAQTNIVSTKRTSFGTETSQTQTERIISSPSTEQTRTVTSTFSTPGIRTDSPGVLVCPEATGIFPHPTDETKFLLCLEFEPTVMNCPEDLIYDPALKECTWRRRNRM